MDPTGVYRIKNPDPKEDGVWVTDGITEQEITEDAYLSNGYKPKLKSLPWGEPKPEGKTG
ncbi:hypothetical protein [Beijerinckia mobilis]|uniref:hypothetical protein n=1 Tax=Beijerinckia mobilis TaxID=231434 RepID=UPI00055956C7|nr:hypothetical protein [Beijerinckia mobilis]